MFQAWITQPRIAVFGGSFNPPHIGHLRAGIEVFEALIPKEVLFIPAKQPPHKPDSNLLPFDMRVQLLKLCTRDLPGFTVSTMEGEREGPSYTIDTLEALCLEYPDYRLCFILGLPDFALLNTWQRWREITAISDILVVSREQDNDVRFFTDTVSRLWPEAGEAGCYLTRISKVFVLTDGGAVMFMHTPRIDISSSDIRRRFLTGTSIKYMVPPQVEAALTDNAGVVVENWLKKV